LFAPLSLAVIFAMLASYLLSRTLVPTMVLFLLGPEERRMRAGRKGGPKWRSIFRRVGDGFEAGFEKVAARYEAALAWALGRRGWVARAMLAFAACTLLLYPFVGRDFFPSVDAGQLRLHVRCPPGTR